MSQKERDRLKVLHEAKKRHITQKEAAAQIGVTERWVRKLLSRMRQEGDRAVVHRLRGRRSNRRIREPVREKAWWLAAGFDPGEPASAATVPGTVGAARGLLHRQSQPVSNQSAPAA